MGRVVVDGVITVRDRAARDALVAASVDLQRATRDEPGCLAYCFAADPVVEDRVQVYELWESEQALDDHLHHDNYRSMFALAMGAGIVSAPSHKHLVERTARVYGPGRKPSGFFDDGNG